MRKGTTLIEVILYTIIAGFFVTTITIFAWNAISAKNRSDSQVTVNDSAQVTIEELQKAIRNASEITSPSGLGSSSNILSLNYPDGTFKTFDVESSRLRLSNNGSVNYIFPNNIVVDEINFTNVSKPGSLGAIQIHLKMKRANPSNLTELSALSEINTTASLRN